MTVMKKNATDWPRLKSDSVSNTTFYRTNAYDKEASVIQYIMKGASANLKKIALIDSSGQLSYEELLSQTQYLSDQLKNMGIKCGDSIVLLAQADTRLIILILGILSLGAHYVVIDKSYPQAQIDYILNDCNANFLITEGPAKTDHFPVHFKKIIDLKDFNFSPRKEIKQKKLNNSATGSDPAYVIYTSGSTGNPKGIMIPHRAINNHMLWMIEQFSLTSQDRFLLKTPLTFDPSVWEIFLPLILGATLIIAKPGTHIDIQLLNHFVQTYQITVLQLVPFVLHRMLLNYDRKALSSLRYLFVGGESLSSQTKRLFFKKFYSCRLINLYGPAEATIDTTYHEVKNNEDHITHNYIGQPIYNTCVKILNEKEELCGIDEVGELLICGDGVGLGYVNSSLNQGVFEKGFIKNTFSYRTGDLVKWSATGILEYIGRKDRQVKINGVRVEIDSLRKVILSDIHVYDCHIDLRKNENHQFFLLTCYLIPNKESKINIENIKIKLAQQFPQHMLPHQYFVVTRDYLSVNGKIDFRKIEQSYAEHSICNFTSDVSTDDHKLLFDIWQSILQIPIESDEINFFDLGGDSISAYILLTEINNAFSINMNPQDILHHPTIKQQSEYIKQQKNLLNSSIKSLTTPIIRLNANVDKKCILIHPIGGTIFWYLHLSSLLDGLITLYGVQDPGIAAEKMLFGSIEEMAYCYADYILSQYVADSYILGGASFGATVAIEIAKILVSKGKSVESIQIFDGWAVYPKELQDPNYFRTAMLRQQNEWSTKLKKSSYCSIDFEKIFALQLQRLDLLFQYKASSFTFHVDLYKAETIMPVFQMIDDPYNHWNNYTNHLNVQTVSGNHETMFSKPHVSILVEKFRNNLLCLC